MKHTVVLDFEMCMSSNKTRNKSYNKNHEIIQWAAVLLDEKYDIIDEFNSYVKPEYGKLDNFISSLTGITWEDISKAPDFNTVANNFVNWVPLDDVDIVSWSDSDLNQLKNEMNAKEYENQRLSELMNHWVDAQVIFSQKINNMRNYSLEEAIIACDIDCRGRAHNGLDDAYNTALLYKKLMTESVLKFNKLYEDAKTKEQQHLSCSLGELLAGFNFDKLKEDINDK